MPPKGLHADKLQTPGHIMRAKLDAICAELGAKPRDIFTYSPSAMWARTIPMGSKSGLYNVRAQLALESIRQNMVDAGIDAKPVLRSQMDTILAEWQATMATSLPATSASPSGPSLAR
jgi:hypothetical protein